MKKLLLLLLFIPLVSFGQEDISIEKDWTRIYIDELGSFDLPPSMEIQDGLAKEITENYNLIMELPSSNVIAQQKGMNEDMTIDGTKGNGGERYVRVMLYTNLGKKGEFPKLYCESSPFSKTDMIFKNLGLKRDYEQGVESAGGRIIEWFSVGFKKINQMCALHISYIRSGNKSNVKVDEYKFFNYDREYQLILSYRVNEEGFWGEDLKKILNSFTITNER